MFDVPVSDEKRKKKDIKNYIHVNNNYKIIHNNVFAYATEWFIFKLIILYIIVLIIIIV